MLTAGKTNVARRLDRFVRKLMENVGNEAEVGVWIRLARSLGLPDDMDESHRQYRITIAIARFYKDIEVIRDRVLARDPTLEADALDEPLDLLRQSFRLCTLHFNGRWGDLGKGAFSGAVRASLRLWGTIIGDDEDELESLDLTDFRAALNDARLAILSDNDERIDSRFRATMLDLIEQLEAALEAYHLGGMEGVQKALRAFWVASMAARDQMTPRQNTASVKAVWDVFQKLRPALEVALAADDFYRAMGYAGGGFSYVLKALGVEGASS
jgi:hypothetical protein